MAFEHVSSAFLVIRKSGKLLLFVHEVTTAERASSQRLWAEFDNKTMRSSDLRISEFVFSEDRQTGALQHLFSVTGLSRSLDGIFGTIQELAVVIVNADGWPIVAIHCPFASAEQRREFDRSVAAREVAVGE
jgi:hypothetical protein